MEKIIGVTPRGGKERVAGKERVKQATGAHQKKDGGFICMELAGMHSPMGHRWES